MRSIALVSSLGGLVLLGLAGCGDHRSARRDESWRDWPTSGSGAATAPDSGGGAASGRSGGSQPASGPVDSGAIPTAPGADVRSGDHRDYRWDTSTTAAPIVPSPGVSGANYGSSTVIEDPSLNFSPRGQRSPSETIIVGGGGGVGRAGGIQPAVGSTAVDAGTNQPANAPGGTFGLPAPGANRSTTTATPSLGSGTTIISNPLDPTATGGTVNNSTTFGESGNTTGGVTTTPGSGTSTGSGMGNGGVITTPGTGTSTGASGTSGGFTTGVPGAGTSTQANPLSGSSRTPEQGAIQAPGAVGSGAATDRSASGATANPGAASTSGGAMSGAGTSGGAGANGGGASGGGAGGAGGGGGAGR